MAVAVAANLLKHDIKFNLTCTSLLWKPYLKLEALDMKCNARQIEYMYSSRGCEWTYRIRKRT